MKKLVCTLVAAVLLCACMLPAFAQPAAVEPETLRGTTLYVYNWGDYMSLGADGHINVNKAFEEKYGITVVYDTYANNEAMYSKIKAGGVQYDVVIPSDYMIGRMISEDMLEPLEFANIPNYQYIAEKYKNLEFDPNNMYSVPYNTGMVGLIYNKQLVKEAPTSWESLWDEQYKGQILMINNQRDAFAIAQSLLGQDFNTTNPDDWAAARDLLLEQKPLVQAYVDDEVYSKMEGGEAALAPYFAGDYLMMLDNNPNLGFVYPKEGVNSFVDSACVLKGAQNKAAAELYINFLLEPEIALANAEYICYASPNTAVIENETYTFYNSEILYPGESAMPKTQIFLNLPQQTLDLMSEYWNEVKSSGLSGLQAAMIGIGTVVVLAAAYLIYRTVRNKKRGLVDED